MAAPRFRSFVAASMPACRRAAFFPKQHAVNAEVLQAGNPSKQVCFKKTF
ncbi:MAG: hypothetical protein AVDCRST_MAG04-3131 [uncultured Acetobacteraceae bacterium]|uniref:Uncharacterized protein n=1 Tax=uncultured Acetobacteraceae bacterium TaxID=169975 RepID=A0A6J4J8F9_9PROT|nr:MAG: hypothetical protein AVDCRST_MAG04-3131 [uncultured Acetobacteraceae bacterium]